MTGHRPRKRFGQNFLVDQHVVGRIISAIAPTADDHIIEIGPGQGALTLPLARSGARLTLIELDRDLAARLEQHPELADAKLLQADALKVDFGELGGGEALRVVGNLPYNISTPLLFHVLETAGSMVDAHFMLQSEVVDRMQAAPGNRTYGRLSVMLQQALDVERLFAIGAGAFRPAPRVESAMVRLRPRAVPARIEDRAWFDRLVRAAFAKRRKQLGNALRDLVTADTLSDCGIDPSRRAETLSPDDFAALANASLREP